MPRIAEIKEIDGHIWVRTDISKDENGSAWWSPAEQEAKYNEGRRDATSDAKALVGELVEVLGDAKATIEYYDRFVDHPDHEQGVDSKPIEAALTKATAWLEGK